MLAYSFAIIGFNIRVQGTGMDLARHFKSADMLRGFETVWDYIQYRGLESNFLYPYYLKLATYFGNQMLPFISTLISMLLLFSILKKECDKYLAGFTACFTTLLYMCLAQNFLIFASGIRQIMAFLVFLHLYQIESFEDTSKIKKILCYIAYGLLCFFHTSVLIVVMLRVVSRLGRRRMLIICPVLLIWTTFWNSIQSFLAFFNTSFSNELLTQMEVYREYSTTAPLMYLIWAFQIGLFGCVLLYVWRNMPEWRMINSDYFAFCVCSFFFAIGCFNYYTPFNRMNMFCWLLTCKLLPAVVQDMKQRQNNIYIWMMNGSTLLTCAYYFVSTSLASDSNVYWYSAADFLTTNVITIFWRLLERGV